MSKITSPPEKKRMAYKCDHYNDNGESDKAWRKAKPPPEKKRMAYKCDHYNDNGESDKAWRKAKPLRKAKARRAFRKASKDSLRVCGAELEAAPVNALRQQGSIQQRRVTDWGVVSLREFVLTRRVRNQANTGAKKARRACRLGA